MGIVVGVMRGTIRGRYVGDRLRAAVYVREDRVGKPIQRHQVSGSLTLAELVTASLDDPPGEPKPG